MAYHLTVVQARSKVTTEHLIGSHTFQVTCSTHKCQKVTVQTARSVHV